jgi:hypothetical protein
MDKAFDISEAFFYIQVNVLIVKYHYCVSYYTYHKNGETIGQTETHFLPDTKNTYFDLDKTTASPSLHNTSSKTNTVSAQ